MRRVAWKEEGCGSRSEASDGVVAAARRSGFLVPFIARIGDSPDPSDERSVVAGSAGGLRAVEPARERLLVVALRPGADERLLDHPALEQHHRGDREDPVAARRAEVLVDVQPDE